VPSSPIATDARVPQTLSFTGFERVLARLPALSVAVVLSVTLTLRFAFSSSAFAFFPILIGH
jgi:hypothetical protein